MSATASSLALPVLVGGFALGGAFGAVAQRANYCSMGALSDIVNMGSWGRARMWLLAIAVAMAGATALQLTGQADIGASIYRRSASVPWLSLLVGGLVFGVGMTLAGGCANKNLLRLGAGSVRSLVVLVFTGLAAYMTLKGLFAQWRVATIDRVTLDVSTISKDSGVPQLLAALAGVAPATALAACAGAAVLGLLAFVFADARFRRNRLQVTSGTALGALVVVGWYVSGRLGFGENPETLEQVYFATHSRTIESLSFVAPTAYSLELLLLWTDKSLHLSFGIATLVGVVLGAGLTARLMGTFRWEGFASLSDLRRQLVGAGLMGFGGVCAMGCTVGQGLTGLSTLALGSFIAVAGVVAGSVVTLRFMLRQAEREAR